MATRPKIDPVLTDIRITYSVAMRANIGNYEHADAFLSKGETWSTVGLSTEEAEAFFAERYETLQSELGEIIVGKYEGMLKGEI